MHFSGVAVLGSLLGGVQLFAMIKMLGLIKQDMSPHQNEWAWCGYQVSMRVLEVAICTLLAIIATTPLRSSGPSELLSNYGNYSVANHHLSLQHQFHLHPQTHHLTGPDTIFIIQATTAKVGKTVRAFYSIIVVVSTIAVVCCYHGM